MAEFYEGFAAVYDRWAADMTEDVPFYVELAQEDDGPWSSWPSARGASRFRSPRESVAR